MSVPSSLPPFFYSGNYVAIDSVAGFPISLTCVSLSIWQTVTEPEQSFLGTGRFRFSSNKNLS